jgi:RAT1-interacting protein
MAATFPIHPISRFDGRKTTITRPKEFTCFSYDDTHTYRQDASSIRYYYPPILGADLSRGFDKFDRHDDSVDEHLDSLLRALQHHESQGEGDGGGGEGGVKSKKVAVDVVTWRGMMTKILATPYSHKDGFEMNATRFQDTIYIEEHNAYKQATRGRPAPRNPRRPSPEVMTFWGLSSPVHPPATTTTTTPHLTLPPPGYKFETLSTLARPWGQCSREEIEQRDDDVVSNKAQYCSVVRTSIGSTWLCLGGEVDAIWDSKPEPGRPINWVELKTSQDFYSADDEAFFAAKMMRFWIQSFLLGVPRIVVGFRSRDGILQRVEEFETARIPDMVSARRNPPWNAQLCINFAADFLAWLRETLTTDGVWRIRRAPGASHIEIFQVEHSGHGRILTPEFIEWRSSLGADGS